MSWLQKISLNNIENLEAKVRHIYLNTYGCCSLEVEALRSSSYDIDRLGFRFVDKASEASLMLVSGWLNEAFVEQIKKDYSQLLLDKTVIAVGACAISGSPYSSQAEKKILSDIIPVNLYLPGCPPRPEALIEALIQLEKQKINYIKDKKKWLHEVIKQHG